MEQGDIVLEVKDLSVSFDGRTVVDNVGYMLRRGRTLGIVGESGSGKSVSSLAIMGLLPSGGHCSVEGSIRFFGSPAWYAGVPACENDNKIHPTSSEADNPGIELVGLDEDHFRHLRGNHIAMIFQEPMTSLNPVQRCGAQVVEMLRLHEEVSKEEARRRAIALFNEVLLPRPEKIFDSYPHELSGGQKQRVMIAMALICNPDIIIADEPTTALDVTVQKTILDLLRHLQQQRNIAVIFISHDLGVIAQVADDIAVMYRGRIVEQGLARQVLANPRQPYTQGLLACRPPLNARPRRLPTVSDFMKESSTPSSPLTPLNPPTPSPPSAPLLSVRNLSVLFDLEKNLFGKPRKQLTAVDSISFDVFRGETFGLVGESGCGKTTLGRAILRLIDSASGSITFDGLRLDTLSQRQMRRLRQKIQIVFQDPYSSLNPRKTIGQAIMEPLLVSSNRHLSRSEARRRVVDLMDRVGLLPEWFDRYPHEFSGGQRQRVCIARALILQPDLVICDESVSALDVSVQAQVLNLLNELKEQYGYTYIFISHDLSVVHFLSDRIMVMRRGALVELAESDQLFSNPTTEYTKKLLDAIPKIDV